jgi:hypothetical protein
MKNNERKRLAVILNVLLLLWYALSMFGVRIGDAYLVEGAFRDEWIFLLIPTLTFILYLSLGKTGKVIHLAWLSMWFITQFLSHEWYSIFGKGFMGDVEGKIDYFRNCIKLIDLPGRYVPDLYHIVLHLLIVAAFVSTLIASIQGVSESDV